MEWVSSNLSVYVLALSFCVGAGTLLFGKQIPGALKYIPLCVGLFLSICNLLLGLKFHGVSVPTEAVKEVHWLRHGSFSQIFTLGLAQDGFAWVLSILNGIAIGVFALFFNAQSLARKDLFYSGLVFMLFSADLSWSASSVWSGILATTVALFSGILMIASQGMEKDSLAESLKKFIWSGSAGILLLAFSRVALLVSSHPLAAGFGLTAEAIAIVALIKAFPFILSETEKKEYSQILFCPQVWISWAMAPLFLRHLLTAGHTEFSEELGWLYAGIALLTFIQGLFQLHYRGSLWHWHSALICVAAGFCQWGYKEAGLCLFMTAFLSGNAIHLLLDSVSEITRAPLQTGLKFRILFVAVFLLSFGIVGSVGFEGFYGALKLVSNDVLRMCFILISIFLAALTLWRVFWDNIQQSSTMDPKGTWGPLVFGLLSFSWVWVGNPLSQHFSLDVLNVFPSLMGEILFLHEKALTFEQDSFLFLLGILVLSGGVGYWLRNIRESPTFVSNSFLGVLRNGFYVVDALLFIGQRLRVFHAQIEYFVTRKAWERFVDEVVASWIQRASVRICEGGRSISTVLDRGVGTIYALAAKSTQVLQSGDVQWYVILMLGLAYMILFHFFMRI